MEKRREKAKSKKKEDKAFKKSFDSKNGTKNEIVSEMVIKNSRFHKNRYFICSLLFFIHFDDRFFSHCFTAMIEAAKINIQNQAAVCQKRDQKILMQKAKKLKSLN